MPETVSEAEFNGDVLINLMEEIQHSGYEWSVNSTVIASLLFVFKHTGQKKKTGRLGKIHSLAKNLCSLAFKTC